MCSRKLSNLSGSSKGIVYSCRYAPRVVMINGGPAAAHVSNPMDGRFGWNKLGKHPLLGVLGRYQMNIMTGFDQ